MKVMVIVKANKLSEAGQMPTEQMLREMGKFNEELVKSGIMLAGEGLLPSSKGTRVHFSKGKKTVVDGPFSETKELVGGFWIWQVKSWEEAVEWVKRMPNPGDTEDSIVEIRKIASPEDFAEADPTGEIRQAEAELRKKAEGMRK